MIEIREATEADISDIARIHLASKLAAETGIVDADFLNAKTQEEYEEKWTGWLSNETKTFLIFKDSNAVGMISSSKLLTPPPGMSKIRPLYSSEILALYIDPDYFRQELGKKLFQCAVQDLIIQKHKSLCLWALDKNRQACNFYEAMGGQRVGKKMLQMGNTNVKEVCYGWRDIGEILEK